MACASVKFYKGGSSRDSTEIISQISEITTFGIIIFIFKGCIFEGIMLIMSKCVCTCWCNCYHLVIPGIVNCTSGVAELLSIPGISSQPQHTRLYSSRLRVSLH